MAEPPAAPFAAVAQRWCIGDVPLALLGPQDSEIYPGGEEEALYKFNLSTSGNFQAFGATRCSSRTP